MTSVWPKGRPCLTPSYEAADAREAAIAETVQEIRKEAEKRRACGRKKAVRPERYLYTGLPEEWRTEYPKDINLSEYDIIGKDVERILHRTPARVWVECVERPVLRKKGEKDIPSPHILQAPAPVPVLGGGHVAADFLAGVLTDKFVYHIPEYRQVKMYADAGGKLSTSTLNDWVHRTAGKLYPLYETLIDDILQSDYLQVDEVLWRIRPPRTKLPARLRLAVQGRTSAKPRHLLLLSERQPFR